MRSSRWRLLALCTACTGDPADPYAGDVGYTDSTDDEGEQEHLGPPSTGHLPILEVRSELPYRDLEVDPIGRIWVAGWNVVGGLDDQLALAWQEPFPAGLRDLLADDGGGWLTLAVDNDDVGFARVSWATPVADPIPDALGVLARFRDGIIAVDVDGGIRHLGPDGQLRWSTDLAVAWVGAVATTTSEGGDRLGLGGYHWAGSFAVSNEVPPTIEPEFLVPFEWGEHDWASVNAIGFAASGRLTVTGELYADNGDSTYRGPWTAQLDATGEFAWEWAYWNDVPVRGENTGLVIAADGSIYTVGTEDPATWGTGACDSFGCDGIVVRKHAPDGDLVWQYEHRLENSSGTDIAIDANGAILVAGTIDRGLPVGVLFRFEAGE